MLSVLRIKNLALVSELTLELAAGYNVITGETGAGKSVIIGALKILLGERADRTLIRSGAESCSVEAIFTLGPLTGKVNALLQECGFESCEDGQLLLKRVFSSAGSNKQFINGSPATLSTLAVLGEWLVDMHGPHDHQSLLRPANQLEILDAYGGLHSLRNQFANLVTERSALLKSKSDLIVDERTYAQQLDLLRFQVREITSAKLDPEEESQLESEYARASNSARLLELAQAAQTLLSEDEASLLQTSGRLGRLLQDLRRIDPGGAALEELHELAATQLRELQRALSHYLDSVECDPARLQELENRLSQIQSLKRKYGSTLQDVIQFGNEARQKLLSLESRDEELERLNQALAKVDEQIKTAGHELSAARKKIIPKLSKAVAAQLQQLGFRQSSFSIQLNARDALDLLNRSEHLPLAGFDEVDFLFAPNPGEPPRPLKAIASSGELARVMLALKNVLALQDQIPVLVFDEVDANVGGETATAVGHKMREVGERRQVLCITHLAPVAAAAQTHYLVTKELQDGRTISRIEPVTGPPRVEELARMLGGGPAARKHAAALLQST